MYDMVVVSSSNVLKPATIYEMLTLQTKETLNTK